MKLLFDQNLSPKLTEVFKDSLHVQNAGLDLSDDLMVFRYAKKEGYTIVTKDSDFNNLISYFGFPPKVIWVRRGNCSTNVVRGLLQKNLHTVEKFLSDKENGILSLL